MNCLFGYYKSELYPFFTEGIAEYLAHGVQCYHITMLAREYGLNHKSRLDIPSIIDLVLSSGQLVYDVGFLLIAYMAKQAPLILAEFMTALKTDKKKQVIDELLQLFAKNNQHNFEGWIMNQYVLYSKCAVLRNYPPLTPLKAVCSHLFQSIQHDNAKIKQFLKRHKLDNFAAFQRKIKHFKLEEVYMPTLQNALANLQFPIFRTLVNNQWLTINTMLQINAQYREYFEQFTDHYTQALEANKIAQQVLHLKKYQITPPLSSLVGLFNYVYPAASYKPTLIDLYRTATSFIDLLGKEAVCKQLLEKKINLRTAIKDASQNAISEKASGYTIGPFFFAKMSHLKPSQEAKQTQHHHTLVKP